MSSYAVRFTARSGRDYGALEPALRQRVANALDRVGNEPLGGKALKGGLAGLRSVRVGEYRILYRFDPPNRLVWVVAIGHRRDIYR
ncbi:MAG: type II toxin-antitoxin system RelE/ParE family toxin [Elusimicrobia bacterium]|nr:type II toxin-antitoxin system RelE/ParE family toxin [Elusimicrobiota bacterium]